MAVRFGPRVQTALVVLLFLGSLAALTVNSVAALLLPQREQTLRDRVRAAAGRLAREAAALALTAPEDELAAAAEAVLADAPETEGGIYLADEDLFAGYAFPTGGEEGGRTHRRHDPPPKEAPFIRFQAQQSLSSAPGEVVVQTRTVGPSRVAVATAPVGSDRPARRAAWAMVRLTGPDQQQAALGRYQVSTGLALGGVVLALVLTANLGRTLRRERATREKLRDELRRAEHLAALGKLLAGVAHEVRNPLAGIRSTVQLWQRLPEQALTPASMDAVIGAVDRLDAIVRRLLVFARSDQDERRPVDLNGVVAETLELLKAQAEAQRVSLAAELAPDLPFVTGSPQALRQVVLNLATNSLQAMPDGGRLDCGTRLRDGAVELRVADTGTGIAVADRAHLFEPFFTTRPDGTGLGLALCREIVLRHGGRIELEPADAGTAFRVLLPLNWPRMNAGEPR